MVRLLSLSATAHGKRTPRGSRPRPLQAKRCINDLARMLRDRERDATAAEERIAVLRARVDAAEAARAAAAGGCGELAARAEELRRAAAEAAAEKWVVLQGERGCRALHEACWVCARVHPGGVLIGVKSPRGLPARGCHKLKQPSAEGAAPASNRGHVHPLPLPLAAFPKRSPPAGAAAGSRSSW